jgi:hypothetical protein
MVKTAEATQCPAQPKRGWILVADETPGETILASGIIVPKEIDQHLRYARILELGLPPIDFRTGIEKDWDYTVGMVVMLSDQANSAWLPMTWQGRKIGLVNEMHVVCIWRGEEQ